MADETQVTTSTSTETPPSYTPTESVKEEKAKTNTLLIVLIVVGILIVGFVSFFVGNSLNATDATPTPTATQNNQVVTVEPTDEEATPTDVPTETPMPTTAQQSTPTSSQNVVTPTVSTP